MHQSLSVVLWAIVAVAALSQQTAADADIDVFIPPQVEDGVDPCGRRYEVQEGESCSIVAQKTGISVDDLLLLNPGLRCSPFFAEMHLCVDSRASGRVLDAAASEGGGGFRMMSREELQFNLDNADTPAIISDSLDTGTK